MIRNGFSLAELMVALGLTSLVTLAVMGGFKNITGLMGKVESSDEIGMFMNLVKTKARGNDCISLFPIEYLTENIDSTFSFNYIELKSILIQNSILSDVSNLKEGSDYRIFSTLFKINYKLQKSSNTLKSSNLAVIYFKTDLSNRVLSCSISPYL